MGRGFRSDGDTSAGGHVDLGFVEDGERITAVGKFTDRSRIVSGLNCRRQRFWGYEFQGRGVAPKGNGVDAFRGKVIHAGFGELLTGGGSTKALVAMEKAIKAGKGIDPWVREWIGEMAEGLLWVFFYTLLPKLLKQYEVLSVEREESRELYSGMIFLSRADALLRSKLDDKLTLLSIKTKKQWHEKDAAEYRIDMQGLSEAWAMEERLEERVSSVQMLYAIIGKEADISNGSGASRSASLNPSWIGYRRPKDGDVKNWPKQCDYAHSWKFTGRDGKMHTLGNSWEKFRVAKGYPGGIQAWVKDCLSGAVQSEAGRQTFEELFVKPPVIERDPQEIESWIRQTAVGEQEISERSEFIRNFDAKENPELYLKILDEKFPQNRKHCVPFGMAKRCGFYEICFGSAEWTAKELRSNPIRSGLYEWRTPNHPAEGGGEVTNAMPKKGAKPPKKKGGGY